MNIRKIKAVLFLSLLFPFLSWAEIKIPDSVNLVYTKVTLDNGLTVIIHEDHKAPIVAVNVWYHVGSKNEPKGRNGFAHLFEHLMYQGSENYNDDYFKVLDKIGATDMNGTTDRDRTNYFQNVPATALDTALFMESDRMGHFVNAISQFNLDEQRKVVLNEKRNHANEPYWGVAQEKLATGSFPVGHPYSWTTIGSDEDLNAASLTDVKEWFKSYYGPNNATLTIVGDVKTQDALEKVKKYFGDIPPGPRISRMKEWIAKRTESKTEIVEDYVPFAKILKIYNIPGLSSDEMQILDVASDILSVGNTSRLYKDLVYDQQIATEVSASIWPGEIASLFIVDATAKEGISLEKLDQAIGVTFQKFFKEGPTSEELKRVNMQDLSSFIQSLEKIGGGGGKANLLAYHQVYMNNPGAYQKQLAKRMNLTTKDIRVTAQKWLSSGDYNLQILPFPKFSNAQSTLDRKKLPMSTTYPETKFPTVQEATLSNGIRVLLAQRTHIPTIEWSMFFNAGYVKDPKDKQGLNRITYGLLDEGTKKQTMFQISDTLANLGSSIGAFSGMNYSGISAKTLKQNFEATLDIFADEILRPAFPEKEFIRLQKIALEELQHERSNPEELGNRLLPQLLYGTNHPYGISMAGTGSEKSIHNISLKDVKDTYETWAKPNNATMIVIGDVSMDELTKQLERRFSGWHKGELPAFTIPQVAQEANRGKMFIVDRPHSPQTVIQAAHFYPPYNDPKEQANVLMNAVLGGTFTSRIYFNLREQKGWSYGSYSSPTDLEASRFWRITAPVQTDKTDLAVAEIMKDVQGIVSNKPILQDEFDKQKTSILLELSGIWETNGSLHKPIKRLVMYKMDPNFFQTLPKRFQAVTLADVNASAKKNIHPKDLVWLLVGDKSKILPGLQKQGFKNIVIIDEDGNVKK